MGTDCLYGLVKRYGQKAGVPEIYPHMFRHTAGARLARAGLNAFTIQRRLGHSNVVSSQIYVDLAGPERKVEDERCEEAIEY
ncbi:Tyrosine recombinase XerC [subsurface metagenome]